MTVTIDHTRSVVRKRFSSHSEALEFAGLYQAFKHHVKVLETDNDALILPFIKGRTMYELLNNPSALARLMPTLSHHLRANHTNFVIQEPNYRQVCTDRGHYPFPTDFTDSIYTTGTIHGDLNLKNIIITDSDDIVFIDRLEAYGDILFDFSFLMSFLCRYIVTGDDAYLSLIRTFFDSYLINDTDRAWFPASFRNNFLNYGYLVANDAQGIQKFSEWSAGKSASRWLADLNNSASLFMGN